MDLFVRNVSLSMYNYMCVKSKKWENFKEKTNVRPKSPSVQLSHSSKIAITNCYPFVKHVENL